MLGSQFGSDEYIAWAAGSTIPRNSPRFPPANRPCQLVGMANHGNDAGLPGGDIFNQVDRTTARSTRSLSTSMRFYFSKRMEGHEIVAQLSQSLRGSFLNCNRGDAFGNLYVMAC